MKSDQPKPAIGIALAQWALVERGATKNEPPEGHQSNQIENEKPKVENKTIEYARYTDP